MIELQRAVTPDQVWRACLKLMRSALPVRHVLLGLPSLGVQPFFVRSDMVLRNIPRLTELAPLNAVLLESPGRIVTRLSDHFTPRAGEPFYDEFMKPEGWLYSAAMLFWSAEGTFVGQLAFTRAVAQGDVTEAEMALLRRLHPHVNAAVQRLLALEHSSAAHKSLEQFVDTLPVGVAAVDWDLNVNFVNRAAREAMAVWGHGRKRARALKTRPILPRSIRAACEQLKEDWTAAFAADDFTDLERAVTISHPKVRGFEATVQITQPATGRGLQPSFTIVFALPALEDSEVRCAFAELSKLTSSEKGIARLAASGHDNAGIARELGISQSTVRTHLRHVFRKLGITTRAKLSPLHQQLGNGQSSVRRRVVVPIE